ncbi:MAG: TPM domain-containing protein [Chitinophagales bacterium]|nr:TPM domain-containing protein [Chitinophagales bacterium]MCZ2392770.1 TPM domain-containing protein [Chitinophagales bacterium]
MSNIHSFFKQPEAIVQAIQKAELKTSGEIKIHLESRCSGEVMQHATEIFHYLKMQDLPQKNGVLIYISISDHKICILGDANIHSKVGNDYWDGTVFKLSQHFKKNQFDKGIIEAILEIGESLHTHFPYDKDNDTNDLNDNISYGI